MERDADFLHKKAERATLRVCLRDKYRLPKVNTSKFESLQLHRNVYFKIAWDSAF